MVLHPPSILLSSSISVAKSPCSVFILQDLYSKSFLLCYTQLWLSSSPSLFPRLLLFCAKSIGIVYPFYTPLNSLVTAMKCSHTCSSFFASFVHLHSRGVSSSSVVICPFPHPLQSSSSSLNAPRSPSISPFNT